MPIIHDAGANILRSRMQTLVCPVNVVGVMGAGLALKMSQEYKGLLQQYRRACYKRELRVDTLWMYQYSSNRKILCFPTKKHWKDPSDIRWIDDNLRLLSETYQELGITSLAMPKIGCGHGLLDWEDVRPLIYNYLSTLPIDVMVYGP